MELVGMAAIENKIGILIKGMCKILLVILRINKGFRITQISLPVNLGHLQIPLRISQLGIYQWKHPIFRGGGGPEICTCYRCRQPGHLANKCPNERVREDYAPICGNCKQSGHIYQECNAPFNPNNRDQKVQEEKGRLHQVNRVETVKAVLTRAQQKGKGPMIEETGPMQEEPEPILVDTNVKQAPNKEPIASSSHQPEVVPGNIALGSNAPKVPSRPILINPPMQQQPIRELLVRPSPMPMQNPSLVVPRANLKLPRKKRALGIVTNMEPYDILKDLDVIQPSITMKQLLAVAPECRSALNSSLIRKRHRNKEIHEVSLNPDPGAPTIDVTIDGLMIPGVQIDGGSSVNLMNVDTMDSLDLTGLIPTTLILRMADHSRVKPLGILRAIQTVIAGIMYHIDYIIFKIQSSSLSYPILLGRPWLYQAKAKNDWDRGTLTIGQGTNKIVLQMYPVQYHGESQLPPSEMTSEVESDSDEEEIEEKVITPLIQLKNKVPMYQCGGPGEYLFFQDETDNSDHAIASWMNNYVVRHISEMEPEFHSSNMSEYMNFSETEEKILPEPPDEPICQDVNLGTDDKPQNIKLYKKITRLELKYWREFFIRYKTAFAWTYSDLKGIPAEVCEHKIVLEDDAKPVRQRQHRLNPKYSLMVKEELDKLLEVGFIYPVPHSEWVSPIVMVPKKNGKIRICQDFRKLNAVTKKDYFPLPFTNTILDAVAGHKCYSFLDGFSGYNQVKIAKEDQLKTTFTTDWGTFAYKVMPFGLCNAPATFQRVMTQAFQDQLRLFMEIFLDDFCTFSTLKDHLSCLSKCLDQCDKYGISLNSDKCTFGVPYGKLLGHIVSLAGIATDPDKVRLILALARPDTVSGVRGFVGHVSYYRRFILLFALICLPLTKLLKKPPPDGSSPVWTKECAVAFEELKRRLATAPILITPCWDKEFQVYVDASNVAIGAVLSQKDKKNFDHPIYYASRQLVAAEQNYTTTEREALGMIYSVQKFRHYLLGYPFVFHVDHDALKYMINKPQLSGRIARWVLLLQELHL